METSSLILVIGLIAVSAMVLLSIIFRIFGSLFSWKMVLMAIVIFFVIRHILIAANIIRFRGFAAISDLLTTPPQGQPRIHVRHENTDHADHAEPDMVPVNVEPDNQFVNAIDKHRYAEDKARHISSKLKCKSIVERELNILLTKSKNDEDSDYENNNCKLYIKCTNNDSCGFVTKGNKKIHVLSYNNTNNLHQYIKNNLLNVPAQRV